MSRLVTFLFVTACEKKKFFLLGIDRTFYFSIERQLSFFYSFVAIVAWTCLYICSQHTHWSDWRTVNNTQQAFSKNYFTKKSMTTIFRRFKSFPGLCHLFRLNVWFFYCCCCCFFCSYFYLISCTMFTEKTVGDFHEIQNFCLILNKLNIQIVSSV